MSSASDAVYPNVTIEDVGTLATDSYFSPITSSLENDESLPTVDRN